MSKYLIALLLLFFTNTSECMGPGKGSLDAPLIFKITAIMERNANIEKLKEEVEYLLNSNMNINNKRWIVALNQCSFNVECHEQLKLLLRRGVDPNHSLCDALFGACASGIVENVKLLLEFNANPNRLGLIYKETPLIRALKSGYFEVFNLLLKNEANPNMKDLLGITPLMYACMKGTLYLIAKQKTFFGRSEPDIFENPPLNIEDPAVCTQIEEARNKFISALLDAGAEIKTIYEGKTARDFALQYNLLEAAELLKKRKFISLEYICIRNIQKYAYTEKELCSKLSPKLQELFIIKKCNTCKKAKSDLVRLFTCGKCLAVHYCSKKCQIKDWEFHKQFCGQVN